MLMSRYFLIAVLVLFSLSIFASEKSGDCEARLAQDRYTGAMRMAMDMQVLNLRDLAETIASDEPVNPALTATPSLRAPQVKRLFAALIDDPAVRAHWPLIIAHLRLLQDEKYQEIALAKAAAEDTEHVFGPEAFPAFKNQSPHLAITELGDGEAVLARVTNEPKLRIEKLSGGAPVVFDVPDLHHWKLVWNRDEEGKLWLYLTAYGETNGRRQSTLLRWEWGADRLQEIPLDDVITSFSVERLSSIGAGQVIAQTSSDRGVNLLNLAGAKAVRIRDTVQISRVDQAAVDGAGNLHALRAGDPRKATLLKTSSGRILAAIPSATQLQIEDRTVGTRVALPLTAEGEIDNLQFVEWKGRIFIAALITPESNTFGKFESQLTVYEPFSENKILYSEPTQTPASGDVHWLTDPNGHLQLAAEYYKDTHHGLYVIDPFTKATSFVGLRGLIQGFYSGRAQSYLWTEERNDIFLYKLFSRTGG